MYIGIMDLKEDPEFCVSTLLHAWLYGFVPVLWTHDIWWPAGAFFSTFFAVTWPAVYRDYVVFPDQIHIHTSLVLLFWIGAIMALCVAWGLRTPSLIDTDPFFSSSKTHAEAELSKTTFHILSVSLFISAEYFLFQYYDTFFSFGMSIKIGILLIILYIFINAGSYIVGKRDHVYKQNASYLGLLATILLTHVGGDLIEFFNEDIKKWYGVLHFVVLVFLFYPAFCIYAWGKICKHDKSDAAKRLLVVTGIIHSFGYTVGWVIDTLFANKNIGVVIVAMHIYSFIVGIFCITYRIFLGNHD